SALRCELNGVGKQVQKNLFDLPLVSHELPKTLVNCNVEVDAVLSGALTHKGAGIIYCQGKIERSHFKLHPSCLHLGKIQNLIDEGQQMAAGGKYVVGVLGLFLI